MEKAGEEQGELNQELETEEKLYTLFPQAETG